MSLKSSLDTLQTNVQNCKTSLRNKLSAKGVTVTATTLTNMVNQVDDIVTGGTSTDYLAQRIQNTLTAYTIPNGVTKVIDYGFRDCSSLKTVVIPSTVTSIGSYSFYNCSGMTSLTFENSQATINSSAFSNCKALKTLNLGNKLKSIGNNAFQYCSGLTTVEIPDSVTTLGAYSFSGCTSLTAITIGSGITAINNYTFRGDSKLKSITCNRTTSPTISNGNTYTFYGLPTTGTLYVPQGKTTAYKSAWIGTSASGGAKLPSGWTVQESVISEPSIVYFTDGTSVQVNVSGKFPSTYSGNTSVTKVELSESVTSVTSFAFSGCTSLTSITIPSSMTYLSSYEFAHCYGLKEIVIPSTMSTITANAFSGCKNVTAITIDGFNKYYECYDNCIMKDTTLVLGCQTSTIPEFTTEIGESAFDTQANMTAITIPSNVTSIGRCAFWGCSSLTEIELPSSISTIGSSTFTDCTSLSSITCYSEVPPTLTPYFNRAYQMFTNLPSVGTLYVPSDSISAYQEEWVTSLSSDYDKLPIGWTVQGLDSSSIDYEGGELGGGGLKEE